MRTCGVLALLLSMLLATPSTALASVPYWSMRKVLHRIDGKRIRVGTRTIRIDSDTTLCSGRGPSIVREGFRRWRRFDCTYTTFTKGGVDRDVEFHVRVLGRLRYAINDAHWV
jgi:hypothetical protein